LFEHTQEVLVKLVHPPETVAALVRHLVIQGVREGVGKGAVLVLLELPLEDAAFTARAAMETRAKALKLANIFVGGNINATCGGKRKKNVVKERF